MDAGPQIPKLINPAWYGQNWRVKNATIVTPNSAPVVLAAANPNRVAILACSANGVWFRWGVNPDIDGLQYLLTQGGSAASFFNLFLNEVGGLVQQTIYAASHTGTAIRISSIEVLWIPIGGA